jgi:hypothetical protein
MVTDKWDTRLVRHLLAAGSKEPELVSSRRVALTLLLLVALTLIGVSASFAQGNPPVVFDGPYHEQGSDVLFDCGSFDVVDHYDLYYSQMLRFDKSGNLVQIVEQVWGTDTLTNSVTGESYTGRFHNTVLIDPSTGIGANAGIIFRITVPGAGAVLLDVGRLVTDQQFNIYFEAGPHQFFNGDVAALCAALA